MARRQWCCQRQTIRYRGFVPTPPPPPPISSPATSPSRLAAWTRKALCPWEYDMDAVQGGGARVVLHRLPSAAPQSATAQPTKAVALQKPMGPNERTRFFFFGSSLPTFPVGQDHYRCHWSCASLAYHLSQAPACPSTTDLPTGTVTSTQSLSLSRSFLQSFSPTTTAATTVSPTFTGVILPALLCSPQSHSTVFA